MKKITAAIWLAILMLAAPLVVSGDVSRVAPISSTMSIKAGYYVLKPACAPKRALTIRKYSPNKYATTVSHTYTKNRSQAFYIEPSTGGTYKIKNLKSGLVLSVKNASKEPRAVVRQTSWGSYNSQRWYFIKQGSYVRVQSSISKNFLTVQASQSANDAKVYTYTYKKNMSGQKWKLVKYVPKSSTPSSNRKYEKTINGKKTLTSFLQNALVPCGRTLYIWGGGHGDSDASLIGYQSSWNTFFKENATPSYDYNKTRWMYGKGLDCSGYVAWVTYNTLYTSSHKDWLAETSTNVATLYEKKGWADIKDGQIYKPGDVVSMSGHVWISLGQYADKSVLLIHSSPKGVQLSGTGGTAATKAAYYMKKYFPEWPYDTITKSSYVNYVHKARWKVNGSGILKDPDGLQKMSADQVMKFLLGS